MEEARAGEMVEEEGEEKVELVIDWGEIKRDEEEVDNGTEEGLWEEFKEGLVEEVTYEGIG